MFVEDMVPCIVQWFNPEEWARGGGVVDVEAYAVEFPKGESHSLAGPYVHDGKHYGLVVITRYDEQRTIEEILHDIKEEYYARPYSFRFFPFSAQKRLEKLIGRDFSQYFSDPITGIRFSDIDLKYGKSELDPKVVARAIDNGQRTLPFWTTLKASVVIQEFLTPEETSWMYEKMAKYYDMVCKETPLITPTVDKPWKLYLCGNDDSSWTSVHATKEEADAALESLRKSGFGYVHGNMMFTN